MKLITTDCQQQTTEAGFALALAGSLTVERQESKSATSTLTAPPRWRGGFALVRGLYDRQCERGQIDFWNHRALRVAKRIGSGQPITEEFLSGMFEPVTLTLIAPLFRSRKMNR